MSLDSSSEALAQRYDEVAYGALPHRLTHPDRLAVVATFLGMAPPDPATSRVLEVGCNDGGNLIPMALALPQARFVGCDLSARAIEAARKTSAALGLSNAVFVAEDLSRLDPAFERFDYIIAHGVYSWVPASVRDALFALAQQRLAADGLMYVSFNALPGCHVRQAVWDMLHHHVDRLADPRERIDAARRFARLLAQSGNTQFDGDEAVRAELRALADRPDSAIFHDDLAVPNEPAYFRDFAAHAARFGLAYLAEAELATMSAAGLSAEARQLLSTLGPLEREQYLDFVRLRRFRQSLLRRDGGNVARTADARWLARVHVAADSALLHAAANGTIDAIARGLAAQGGSERAIRGLFDMLLRRWPACSPVHELETTFDAPAGARPLSAILADAFVGNLVDLYRHPPALTTAPGDRPIASALARLQAKTEREVTTLLHTRVSLQDPNARTLLAMLDGTRDRAALANAMRATTQLADARMAAAFVEHALGQFAKLGLLESPPTERSRA